MTIPAPGRWNATLAIIQQLLARGHTIGVVAVRTQPHPALANIGEVCTKLGVKFYPVMTDEPFPTGADMKRFQEAPAEHRVYETYLRIELADRQVAPVRAAMRDFAPEGLVVDNLAYQGVLAAEVEHAPYVAFSASNRLALPEEAFEFELRVVRTAAAARDALFAKYGVSVGFRSWETVSPWRNLVPTTLAFVGEDAPVAPHTALVGPFRPSHQDVKSFPWDKLDPKKPLVYASFGTVWTFQPDFLRTIAQACAPLGVQLVISGGELAATDFQSTLPGDVLVVAYTPQIELLKRSACFFTHGGMNSVNDALCTAVPSAVLPQANDQFAQGYSIEKSGAGIWIRKDSWSVAECTRVLEALLPAESSYRTAAARVQRSFAPLDGAKEAADAITDLFFGPRARELPTKRWS